ncbi:hypothetical protein N8I77_010745 [Diaporthe amygdali]|uniref:Uncharacterized protein n=1 Tax=Phomopsis amygdali TaxID=1214568 RepID=A0AAD9S8P1_PHOAM|nr:hypothetical protein N8I77_010745 [Diaporthe amygdali]
MAVRANTPQRERVEDLPPAVRTDVRVQTPQQHQQETSKDVQHPDDRSDADGLMWSATGLMKRGSDDFWRLFSARWRRVCEMLSSFSAPASRYVAMAASSSARFSVCGAFECLVNSGSGTAEPFSSSTSNGQVPSRALQASPLPRRCRRLELFPDPSDHRKIRSVHFGSDLTARAHGASAFTMLSDKELIDCFAARCVL